jgi:hypothetical protein
LCGKLIILLIKDNNFLTDKNDDYFDSLQSFRTDNQMLVIFPSSTQKDEGGEEKKIKIDNTGVYVGGYFRVNERYFPVKTKNPLLLNDIGDDQLDAPVKVSIPHKFTIPPTKQVVGGRKKQEEFTPSSDSISLQKVAFNFLIYRIFLILTFRGKKGKIQRRNIKTSA